MSVDGPSIRTYAMLVLHPVLHIFQKPKHTRLWSMISTIVASFPSDGPPLTRAMRPTSTNLQEESLISASPIVLDSGACSSVI